MTAPLVARTPSDVDAIGRELARCAALARSMPRAWDGAQVTHGFTGPEGQNLGRVLPGRGVALASDLRALGITRPIPHVYEKSLAMRAIDACGGRERLAMSAAALLLSMKLGALGMADALGGLALAITNYDGIINARANGKLQDVVVLQGNQTSVATQWHSLMRSAVSLPAGALDPAVLPGGSRLNRASPGALSGGLSNPGGTDKKYLLTVGVTSNNTINILVLVDLLVGVAGISANTTAAQTVNSLSATRYSGAAAAGNLVTYEVTTALGATAANITTTYTNSEGVNGRQTGVTAMTASAITGRLVPAALGPFSLLQTGDIGVRSVETVQLSAAMGAGVLTLYLYRPLHFLPGVGTNVYVERDSTVQIDGLTELVVGSDNELGCLGAFLLPSGTGTGTVTMFLRTVEG